MSSGPVRGRRRSGLLRPTRAGSTKPKRVGLSVIPPVAWPTVAEVLAERGWLGLVVLLAVCYLHGTEVARTAIDGDTVVVFAQRRTRRFVLPHDSAALVERFLAQFRAETEQQRDEDRRRYVANVLQADVEPEVRRRLAAAGHRWAAAIDVSVRSLRRAGIEQLLSASERREFLRVFTRNPRAHPEDLRPPVSLEVMDELDHAVAPFWAAVANRLSVAASAAIAALADGGSGATMLDDVVEQVEIGGVADREQMDAAPR